MENKFDASKLSGNLQERLNLLIACGYPIFVIGKRVSWPVEAEDFFTEEEMKDLEGYILSTR